MAAFWSTKACKWWFNGCNRRSSYVLHNFHGCCLFDFVI